jgi:hypothetical protein
MPSLLPSRIPAAISRLLSGIAAITLCLMLHGCGSFAFAPGSVVSKHQVSEYYPSGRLKSQGWVGVNDQGTAVKTDQWQWWFDNGQLQWQGFYRDNAIDASREWKEWNRNSSLRDTWIDH